MASLQHPRIDDEKILDRYLAGELPAEEEALFEEHLFECAACLERAEWGEEMRRGLRAAAAENAAAENAAAENSSLSPGFLPWLRLRPARLAGFAAFAVVFIALLGAVLWLGSELGRAREEIRLAAAVNADLPGAGLSAPTGDFLVVSLGVVRDAASAVEIRLEPGKDVVLLSLELPAVTAERYRVTLHGAADEILWRGENLEPNLYDTLLVALPVSFLEPGEYRILIEGTGAEGITPAGAALVGETTFRVLPANL